MNAALALLDRMAAQYERDMRGFQSEAQLIAARHAAGDVNLNRVREDLKVVRAQLSNQIAPFDGGPLALFVHELVDLAERDAGAEVPTRMAGPMYDTIAVESAVAAERVRDALRSDELQVMRAMRQTKLARLMGQTPRVPEFLRPDRSGRHWQSHIMVRTQIRELGVQTYTNAFLLSLVGQGYDLASFKGELFTIVGESMGIPTLADMEGKFHPNITELVTKA